MSYSSFKLTYQVSPILLFGGIAGNSPGTGLPIINLLQSGAFPSGLTGPATTNMSLDDYFGQFEPAAGASLISQEIGHYPFANQAVAANAVIAQPLRISMIMICPARTAGGYAAKQSVMTGLQNSLANHNSLGGTYSVMTMSYIYTNCLLTNLEDVTAGDSNQFQAKWRFDFEQPLLTLQQAQAAQNALMAKLGSGTAINGQPSTSGGPVNTQQPVALPSAVPSAQGTAIPFGTEGAAGLVNQS